MKQHSGKAASGNSGPVNDHSPHVQLPQIHLPYVHLAFINAVQLSPYALKPLETQGHEQKNGRSAWDLSLQQLTCLPHRQLPEPVIAGGGLPAICLLPPVGAKLEETVAEVLQPQRLRERGLYPIHLDNYSESALLRAVQKGIEIFYPYAFRPDPVAKALQKYLEYLENPDGETGRSFVAQAKTAQAVLRAVDEIPNEGFDEDVGLPLAMRFQKSHLNGEQLLLSDNLTSRQIHFYWLDADAPLLSLELSRQLYDRHHRYAAELSFSDIYPRGLVPVLFQAAALGRLWRLKQDPASQPDPVSSAPFAPAHRVLDLPAIAERDFNLFAAEPLPADKDYRLLRLELRAGNKRQFLILQSLCHSLGLQAESPVASVAPVTMGSPESATERSGRYLDILSWLENSPQSQRSLPRYFPIQISAFCAQRCIFCPYPKIMSSDFFPPQSQRLRQELQGCSQAAFMPRALWRDLLSAIANFADDAVINLSPLGEPMLHPEFVGLVEDLLQGPQNRQNTRLQLLIETSGVEWQAEEILHLLQLDREQGRITWIIGLDALDPELYRQLRAPEQELSPLTGMTPSQKKAHDMVGCLLSSKHSQPQQVYVQAVRMKDNESDLEAFYRYWAEDLKPSNGRAALALHHAPARPPSQRPQVIVQKYNSYAGLLPERQLLRLDPVERFPCRRLAREMVFGIDGQVYLCVQDLQQELAGELKQNLGCFPKQGLEELWQHGHSLYQQHIKGRYPGICSKCDEYYIHNF